MLERALLLASRFDWTKDAEIAAAFDCVTVNGQRALRDNAAALSSLLSPGNDANFLMLPAETLGDAIAQRPKERVVVSRGEIVAQHGKLLHSRSVD
jgi:cytosine deaminase